MVKSMGEEEMRKEQNMVKAFIEVHKKNMTKPHKMSNAGKLLKA
jgi:hypothetical protein